MTNFSAVQTALAQAGFDLNTPQDVASVIAILVQAQDSYGEKVYKGSISFDTFQKTVLEASGTPNDALNMWGHLNCCTHDASERFPHMPIPKFLLFSWNLERRAGYPDYSRLARLTLFKLGFIADTWSLPRQFSHLLHNTSENAA